MYIIRSGEYSFHPSHQNCESVIIHNPVKTGTKHFGFGISHYHPGGVVEWSCFPLEHVYHLWEGEVVFHIGREADYGKGRDYALRPGDSIYVAEEDYREIRNEGDKTAVMIVVAGEDVNKPLRIGGPPAGEIPGGGPSRAK